MLIELALGILRPVTFQPCEAGNRSRRGRWSDAYVKRKRYRALHQFHATLVGRTKLSDDYGPCF